MYLEIQSYSKRIAGETVLSDITMGLEKGKIYGLKGKNGSGKTMLIRAVCGLIKGSSGTIQIDGKTLGRDFSFPDSVGVLIERPGFLANYSAYQNLKVLADIRGLIGQDEIYNALLRVGLDPGDKKKFKKYSLGMKQKLGIAAAIMENPDMILLDEPANALDEKSMGYLNCILKEERNRGALIIWASHDAEELWQMSDEVFEMDAGQIKAHLRKEDRDGTSEN